MKMFSNSYIKQERTCVDGGLKTVLDCLRCYAEFSGEDEAVVFASYSGDREAITWAELVKKSISVAKSLIQLGVKPGEFVAINLRPCPQWLYIAFGTMFAGACFACISFTYKDGRDLVATMEKMATCSTLVMDPGVDEHNWKVVKTLLDEYSPDGTAASSRMPFLRYVIGYEREGSNLMARIKPLDDLVNTEHSNVTLPEISEDSLAALLQTSGSTGVPKLVTVNQRNLMFSHQIVGGTKGFMDKQNVLFNDRPFSWSGGFPWSVICGQKRVTINGFEPTPKDKVAGIIDIVVREKCNLMYALPPMLHSLNERKAYLPKEWPLETILTGGQPLKRNISETLESVAQNIFVSYGATELTGLTIGVTNDRGFKEYWCGNIVKGPAMEAKVVDENGEIVPVNNNGELYVRSEGVFQGYYNDPLKTAAVLTPDGWYKTDDIGMITEHGEFYVYHRKSNMIISGGMNVAPEILEDVIMQCPGIKMVMVVPIPDEIYYQVVCACLIRDEGSDVTEEMVRAFCEDVHIDKPKTFTVLPKYYVFVESFPETENGKSSRPALIELAKQLIENSGK